MASARRGGFSFVPKARRYGREQLDFIRSAIVHGLLKYTVCVCFFFLKSFARTYPLRFCNLGIPQFLLYAVLIFLRL